MLLDVKQAAKRQHLSASFIYQLCRSRLITHYRAGIRGRGKILIQEQDLEDYFKSIQVPRTPVRTMSRSQPLVLKHLEMPVRTCSHRN